QRSRLNLPQNRAAAPNRRPRRRPKRRLLLRSKRPLLRLCLLRNPQRLSRRHRPLRQLKLRQILPLWLRRPSLLRRHRQNRAAPVGGQRNKPIEACEKKGRRETSLPFAFGDFAFGGI